MAATAITVSGVLTRCDVKDVVENDFNYTHRYSPNTEHRAKYLNCAITTNDGKTIYFCTPHSCYNVTNVPGVAVVTFKDAEYDEETGQKTWPADHSWFRLIGTHAVGTPDNASDVSLEPLIKVGDQITVRGRVKAQNVSRAGRAYTELNHVKRMCLTPAKTA